MTRLWKTLDIDNLPKKFFTRPDIVIRKLVKPGLWEVDTKNSKVGERHNIIGYITRYKSPNTYKYMIRPETVGTVVLTRCIKGKLDGHIIEGCEEHDYYYTEDERIYKVEMIG